jgi:hypothetical protein
LKTSPSDQTVQTVREIQTRRKGDYLCCCFDEEKNTKLTGLADKKSVSVTPGSTPLGGLKLRQSACGWMAKNLKFTSKA